MRKSDWAAIILIVAIVGLTSYFVVGAIMPSPADSLQTAQIAPTIESKVDEPDKKIFSDTAINPTVRTTIGDQSNQHPFNLESK